MLTFTDGVALGVLFGVVAGVGLACLIALTAIHRDEKRVKRAVQSGDALPICGGRWRTDTLNGEKWA